MADTCSECGSALKKDAADLCKDCREFFDFINSFREEEQEAMEQNFRKWLDKDCHIPANLFEL